eukprot:7913511-Pyramimonas_sp.AAC.1
MAPAVPLQLLNVIPDRTLQGQLLFSSVAALLGSAGQSNYAAANDDLDHAAAAQQGQVRSLREEFIRLRSVAAQQFGHPCYQSYASIHACPPKRMQSTQATTHPSGPRAF